MSENTVSRGEYEKVIRQAKQRKFDLEKAQAEIADLRKQAEKLTKERDDAVKAADETKAAYEQFTNENELFREVQELKSERKLRDMADMLNGVDGVEYQQGVTLADVLEAAGIDPGELDEIPEDFATKAIEAARASKPFLFAAQAPAQGEAANTGEVRQEAAQAPPLRAFGAQAVGGGSAPKSEPQIDYSDPVAVLRHAKAMSAGGTA